MMRMMPPTMPPIIAPSILDAYSTAGPIILGMQM
jgi:hypothetical protein